MIKELVNEIRELRSMVNDVKREYLVLKKILIDLISELRRLNRNIERMVKRSE